MTVPKFSPTAIAQADGQSTPAAPADFDSLPDSAYVRQNELIRTTNHPESNAPLKISAPTIWRKIKKGEFPQPVRLSARCVAWRVGDVRKWLAEREATQFVASGIQTKKVA